MLLRRSPVFPKIAHRERKQMSCTSLNFLREQMTELANRYMPTFGQSILSNRLVNRVAVLGSGTALAQLANILATPLLTYLYSPANFGTMAIFMGVIFIVGSLASLCYEAAIILPEDHKEAYQIGALALLISAVISVLSGVVFGALQFLDYVDSISYWWVFLFTPVGVFAISTFNIGCHWRMRSDDVKALSAANIIRTLGAGLVQILAGLLGFTYLGLILGRLVGQVSATFYIVRSISIISDQTMRLKVSDLKKTANRYCLFPIFKAPQSLLALITEQVPAFALGLFFGAAPAGLYWLSHRILKLPCTILSEATGRVFYSECARRYRRSQVIFPFALRTVSGLACIAVVPCIALFFFSSPLFGILGEEWRQAGDYGRWLVIWIFFVFCCSPIMSVFSILEKHNILFVIDLFAMILRVLMIIYLSHSQDDIFMVMAIALFESLKISFTVLVVLILCRQVDYQAQQERNDIDEISEIYLR